MCHLAWDPDACSPATLPSTPTHSFTRSAEAGRRRLLLGSEGTVFPAFNFGADGDWHWERSSLAPGDGALGLRPQAKGQVRLGVWAGTQFPYPYQHRDPLEPSAWGWPELPGLSVEGPGPWPWAMSQLLRSIGLPGGARAEPGMASPRCQTQPNPSGCRAGIIVRVVIPRIEQVLLTAVGTSGLGMAGLAGSRLQSWCGPPPASATVGGGRRGRPGARSAAQLWRGATSLMMR